MEIELKVLSFFLYIIFLRKKNQVFKHKNLTFLKKEKPNTFISLLFLIFFTREIFKREIFNIISLLILINIILSLLVWYEHFCCFCFYIYICFTYLINIFSHLPLKYNLRIILGAFKNMLHSKYVG